MNHNGNNFVSSRNCFKLSLSCRVVEDIYLKMIFDAVGVLAGWRDQAKKEKKKRTHGHGQQCCDCRGRGWVEVEEGIRGIIGNGGIQNK